MQRKRFAEDQIIAVLKEHEACAKTADLAHKHGISETTETGLCENRRTVSRKAVEALVLKGIEEQLATPELIAEYVREYQRMSRELNSSTAHRRRRPGGATRPRQRRHLKGGRCPVGR